MRSSGHSTQQGVRLCDHLPVFVGPLEVKVCRCMESEYPTRTSTYSTPLCTDGCCIRFQPFVFSGLHRPQVVIGQDNSDIKILHVVLDFIFSAL